VLKTATLDVMVTNDSEQMHETTSFELRTSVSVSATVTCVTSVGPSSPVAFARQPTNVLRLSPNAVALSFFFHVSEPRWAQVTQQSNTDNDGDLCDHGVMVRNDTSLATCRIHVGSNSHQGE
jgi:hypothetical protein